mgnify:CR=1 FL=1
MQNLNLNDLLRSGFAGAIFILIAVAAFDNPGQLFVQNKDVAGALGALATAAGLSIGTVIYAVHRAAPYPLLYLLFKVLTHRKESMLDLDVLRWKHSMKTNSLQPRLGDWAAQVHFLYCLAWASVAALLLGNAFEWKQLSTYTDAKRLCAVFFVCALVHHFRYQRCEHRVFQEDAALPDSKPEPKK